ncbi:hypothetical protein PHLH8_20980 [Pseudomonas sp. Pc102]|uniref:hypothetical protein n=1 Tax=Pseudomonas sp. Pc102 TaxID=2678261 RepID=UPI001BCEFF25|nr:hypothetical protein [Pseudomonas sp. Pc102]BBP82456.1 hypothetical protein PHLH8_20980 [Pseudomonas sp. Pc102]
MAVGAAGAAAYAALAAATAVSVYSSVQSGKQAQANANAQAEQAALDAQTERSAAVVQAERIRKLARLQNSEANAALAASGVDIGEGTPININREITQNAEEDASMTIFGGANRAQRLNTDASNYRLAGAQARSSANMQAASTLISSGSQAYSGWRSSVGGTA